MRRRVGSNLNIGTSSLLLIFIVLSLVSFAVLSLSSAITDRNSVDQTIQHSNDYYAACNNAEHQLAELNTALANSYNQGKMSFGSHNFEVTINDNQVLEISIETHDPDEQGYFYTVTKWKVVNVNVPAPDTNIGGSLIM